MTSTRPPATAVPGDEALIVEGLRKVFGHGARAQVAVDDVSVRARAGGCLAIVGESGSGKTTVARILAGLERADAGTVTVQGSRRDASAPMRRRRSRQVQMVFQDPFGSLDPRQRIGDGIAELLAVRAVPRSERAGQAVELLEQVGLDERHSTETPRSLSGGQRQRVAIARALALQPQVLILDEPTSALDVSVQAQVLNLLADLRESTGITYLFVTHNLAVVRQISDQTLVMQGGSVVEFADTDQLLADPQQGYTRRLIASVPRPGWMPQRGGLARSSA